jgi:hypothetical protein
MTRTARAETPSALLKDRSLPRNGRDKHLQKGGAHGWGSIKDEAKLERAAEEDAEAMDWFEEEEEEAAPLNRPRRGSTLGEVKGQFLLCWLAGAHYTHSVTVKAGAI